MPRKRREDVIELTRKKILHAARRGMAERGTAGLSLREIARSIDMTAPALYYYFASLDDLITTLVLEAFNALADALEAARDRELVHGHTVSQALFEVCLAYREWAVEHPTDFELIYGTPIPGYEAPAEITAPAAGRSGEVFGELIESAIQVGELQPTALYGTVSPALRDHMRDYYHTPVLDESIVQAAHYTAIGWPQLHGIVMLELFNHIQPLVGNVETFYREQVIRMFTAIGIALDVTT